MDYLKIYKHLLPQSKAWALSPGKQLTRLFQGLSDFPQDFQTYMDNIFGDIFPQTTRELNAWEFQWGLKAGDLTEQERKDRLDGAWKAQGGQSPSYIQGVLQDAGFPVFIHEWWELPVVGDPVARNPLDYIRVNSEHILPGDPVGYPLVNKTFFSGKNVPAAGEPDALAGEARMLAGNYDGYISLPVNYVVPDNEDLWPYFLYVGGEVFPNTVQIPIERKDELETLLLKIGPAQQWWAVLVEYV